MYYREGQSFRDFEFSVIIPVYNRCESLYLVLCALDRTRAHYGKPVELIIVDDGSTDNPLEAIHEFQDRFALQYRWQPHKGYRAGEAVNCGCAIAHGRNFLVIDADILLTPESLAHLANIVRANPEVIVAGRYDWMLPMHISPSDVYRNWERITLGALPPKEISGKPKGLLGIDPRYASDPDLFDLEQPQWHYAAILFASVMMVPRALYNALGGFDEKMIGHGGQDCELSIRAQLAEYPVIFSNRVRGYHIYHDRDQDVNRETCNQNVQYITRKHDLKRAGLYVWHVRDTMGIARAGEKPPK